MQTLRRKAIILHRPITPKRRNRSQNEKIRARKGSYFHFSSCFRFVLSASPPNDRLKRDLSGFEVCFIAFIAERLFVSLRSLLRFQTEFVSLLERRMIRNFASVVDSPCKNLAFERASAEAIYSTANAADGFLVNVVLVLHRR